MTFVVLLWVYIYTPGKLKNMPDHGRNWTYDLYNSAKRATRSGQFEYVIFLVPDGSDRGVVRWAKH